MQLVGGRVTGVWFARPSVEGGERKAQWGMADFDAAVTLECLTVDACGRLLGALVL